MRRNNSQYLISLGRCKSILRELGKTPVPWCKHERKVTGTLWRENSDIIPVNNRNVMTFCSTVATIKGEFYKQPKVDDYEVEQTRIVAGLKQVWIRYNIRDSARRSQQGIHLYSPNVSLLLLQLLSITASGFTTRYSGGEVLQSRHKKRGWKLRGLKENECTKYKMTVTYKSFEI